MIANELDVALGIADGSLSSPTVFGNSNYWLIRVSGVGCAWRESVGEFAWRDASVWLSDAMVRRASCLPVLVDHPVSGQRIEIDGKPMLVEGDPTLCDHIALCAKGVWTRERSKADLKTGACPSPFGRRSPFDRGGSSSRSCFPRASAWSIPETLAVFVER